MVTRQGNRRDQGELLKKFQLAVKVTIFCIRQVRQKSLRNKDNDEISPFIHHLHFHDSSYLADQKPLLFDTSQFKASRQIRVSEEARRILRKKSNTRTEKELLYLQVALRNIRCFGEIPVRMQKKVAEVGRYESFEAKRAIVRQGHPAAAFYFILSGAVVVVVMDEERHFGRPTAYLQKGQTFGELAIVERTKRQSTVIAKERVELLSVALEDYHRIFMSCGFRSVHDPDHGEFVGSLDFLKGWPINLMEQNQTKCLFLYFKHDEVLVRNSRWYNWLIIVKSGSIRVLKKLRRVKAKLRRRTRGWGDVADGYGCRQDETRSRWKRFSEPEEARRGSRGWTRGEKRGPAPLPHLLPGRGTPSGHPARKGSEKRDISVLAVGEDLGPTRRSSRGVTFREETIRLAGKRTTTSRVTFDSFRRGSIQEIEEEMLGFQQYIRTIQDDLNFKSDAENRTDPSAADLDPVFVHVQTLTKGLVFGINDIILGEQPNFSVVSNGAECILLDKTFYLDHAPDHLMGRLKEQLSPYPTEEELQQRFQEFVNWREYRVGRLTSALRSVRSRRSTHR